MSLRSINWFTLKGFQPFKNRKHNHNWFTFCNQWSDLWGSNVDLMNTDHDAASDKQTTIHQVHNHCAPSAVSHKGSLSLLLILAWFIQHAGDTQPSATLHNTLFKHRCCEWCFSDVALYTGIPSNHCLVLLSAMIHSTCTCVRAYTNTHLSQKEQTLSLSSLTAWLLILLPKYHKTGYNIYNYPHLH